MLKVIAKLKAPINTFMRNGKEETFFKPIGSMVELDNGKTMLLIDKSFNLLAIQHKENAGSVPIYMEYEEVTQTPVSQNKPVQQKAKQSNDKKKKTRPTAAQVQAAKQLLQVDARARETKEHGSVLPFDDEPFDDPIPF